MRGRKGARMEREREVTERQRDGDMLHKRGRGRRRVWKREVT